MPKPVLPPAFVEQIKETLKRLESPVELGSSELLDSPLVKQWQADHPLLTARLALEQVLAKQLQALEGQGSPKARQAADLLRGRFWEGLDVSEMIMADRPEPMGEAKFYVEQKKALDWFALLWWEAEQVQDVARTAEPEPEEPSAPSRGETEQTVESASPLLDTSIENTTARPPSGEPDMLPQADPTAIPLEPPKRRPEIEPRARSSRPSHRIWRWGTVGALAVSALVFVGLIVLLNRLLPLIRVQGDSPTLVPLPTFTPLALPTPPPSSTIPPIAAFCGETRALALTNTARFLRHEGVSAFTNENTAGGVLTDKIRVVAGDATGVWLGTHATDADRVGGLEHYDRVKREWAHCAMAEVVGTRNVNDIAIDAAGNVWAALEDIGVIHFPQDGSAPRLYTPDDHLPDRHIFGLTIDAAGRVWAVTGEGVARFDGKKWDVIYTVANGALQSNDVHAIAFGKNDIWVGLIHRGVSRYRKADGRWVHYDTTNSALAGNEIRRILVRPAEGHRAEEIWFATADGGVAVFSNEQWRAIRVSDGLPSDHVRWVTRDPFGRIWVATAAGVSYLQAGLWKSYHRLDAFSVTFSPDKNNPASLDYPDQDYHVWTGTFRDGLTHSRIPPREGAENVLDVGEVKFFDEDGDNLTPPVVVAPQQKFRIEVTVTPRYPYRLKDGDMLAHVDREDEKRFGVHTHFGVKGSAEAGQPYTFAEYDQFFVAPQLSAGKAEETFTSLWHVWLHTRRVGVSIPITFTVRRASPTPTPR